MDTPKLEDLLSKKCKREIRLRNLERLNSPDIVIENEKELIARADNELNLHYSSSEIDSKRKQAYLSVLNKELQDIEEGHILIDCNNCTYAFKNPDGTFFEGEAGECSLHGKRPMEILKEERGSCESFEEYGFSEKTLNKDYIEKTKMIKDFIKEIESK